MLQPAEQQRLDAWLQSSGHLQRPCPVCRGVAWKSRGAGALAGISVGPYGPTPDVNGPCVGLAAVECSGCGLVLTFSLENLFPVPAP